MSKRCLFLCVTAVAIGAVMAAALPSVAVAQARATIIIDSLASTPVPGDTVTLAVRIENVAPGTSINALDLLIEYDSYFMRLIDLQPGAKVNLLIELGPQKGEQLGDGSHFVIHLLRPLDV